MDRREPTDKDRIDAGQDQQDVTDMITTAHTEQIIASVQRADASESRADASESRADSSDIVMEAIIAGVASVATQVNLLNDRVYTKNRLDETRNGLFRITIIASLTLAGIIAALLAAVVLGNRAEDNRATDRAREATGFRHQLADCTLRPGTILDDGFINRGICYSEGGTRTADVLDVAIERIFSGIRLSDDCLFIKERYNEEPNPCREVNKRVADIRRGINPFETTTTLPAG